MCLNQEPTSREPVHTCEMCGKQFRFPQDLKRHVKSKHELVTYTCAHCPKTFNTASNRTRHQLRCQGLGTDAKRGYCCDVCNKCFTSMAGLKRHYTSHKSKTSEVKCNTCNTVCENRRELHIHKKRCPQ
ncbi:MAG: C2H2-type zinc finger protein [Candidatus Thiodiazotropha sp.]